MKKLPIKRLLLAMLALVLTVTGTRAQDMTATPLTLEAISSGEITFQYSLSLYHEGELTDIEYRLNDGAWTTYTWNDAIAVVANDKVAFRGNNASYMGNGKGYESHITSTADVYVYGNIMSLINSTDFATLTTLTGKDAFSHLFCVPGATAWDVVPNTTIKSHPTKDLVLPATTLTNMCYMNMFSGCQGLTRAPELPATELPVACYASMFEGCTSLTVAPALPTTTFTPYGFDDVTFEEYGSIDCYMGMFKDCTSLTKAPALPATTLIHGVYQNMFQGCTSLERAPDLPAPIVADYAYSYMFDGCTSLNYVKCLATDFLIDPDFQNTAEDNVNNWLNNVAATGTFVKAEGMTTWAEGASGIPAGWTVKEALKMHADGEGCYWATYYNNATSVSADENSTVFTAKINNDNTKVILGEVVDKTILAGNAVVVKSTTAEVILQPTGDTGTLPNNDLQGVTTDIATPANTYMLVKGASGVGFYHWTGANIPAGRGYLTIPSGGVKEFIPMSEGSATAIEIVEHSQDANDTLYDLSGRKVQNHPAPGIYVKNGKKVIIK